MSLFSVLTQHVDNTDEHQLPGNDAGPTTSSDADTARIPPPKKMKPMGRPRKVTLPAVPPPPPPRTETPPPEVDAISRQDYNKRKNQRDKLISQINSAKKPTDAQLAEKWTLLKEENADRSIILGDWKWDECTEDEVSPIGKCCVLFDDYTSFQPKRCQRMR